jgi:hypothetical protein
MFTVLAAAFAVVAFSSVTFAQAPAAEKATKPAVEKAAKPAAETAKKTEQTAKTEAKETTKKATAPTATGTIEKYDAATKTLTVKTKKGAENFTLNADTKIMAGSKAGKEDELVAGKNVKVAYTEAAGAMTATKVTLPTEKAAPKTTTKKEEPKK